MTSTNFAVSPDLVKALQEATRLKTSAIKIEVVGESIVPVLTIPCKGGADRKVEEDFTNHIKKTAVVGKPCFYFFRLNEAEARPKWLLVSWSPDDASVRDKVLYSASQGILVKALPSECERKEYFASTMAELSYQAFLKCGEFDPAVMTEVERVRETEKALPTDTRTRSMCMPSIPISGNTDVPAAVAEAISAKQCLLLTLEDGVLKPKQLTWEQFTANLPEAPSFLLKEDGSCFLYWCPETVGVKVKMQSAVAKATVFEGVKGYFEKEGMPLPRQVEVQDADDLGQAVHHDHHHHDHDPARVHGAQRPSLAKHKKREQPRASFTGEFDF
jgi:hypothetical protein